MRNGKHYLEHGFFFNFIFTLFYFTILYWFCHTLTWICHGCIQAPNLESPSHLPLHIISLDHPCAPAPSILYLVSNIDWCFVSYMIVYMFQCHSPKSSHPLPLPLNKFKMDHKATCKISSAFGWRTANKHTMQWWFKKFCKGDKSL